MPAPPPSVRTLFDLHQQRLSLRWLAAEAGAGRATLSAGTAETPLTGYFNRIHPARLQVLGATELEHLQSLGKKAREDALASLFSPPTLVVLIAGGLQAPQALQNAAIRTTTPLLGSTLASDKLLDHLDYCLADLLADKQTVHGVFMNIMGIGVLLTGESAIGKSELALELISRGHALVADDAPEFYRASPHSLRGRCPEPLRDYLEVRGLGLLDIRAMFGDSAIKQQKNLHLIIHLATVDKDSAEESDRLQGNHGYRTLLGVEVTEIRLPVATGRNLAVLVEAAARNHILHENGYDAAKQFIVRQQRILAEQTAS